MIKARLFGIDRITSKKGTDCVFLHLGVPYSAKNINGIGFDYSIGSCFGDKAGEIYNKVSDEQMIGEDVIIGGISDSFHQISVNDIELQ